MSQSDTITWNGSTYSARARTETGQTCVLAQSADGGLSISQPGHLLRFRGYVLMRRIPDGVERRVYIGGGDGHSTAFGSEIARMYHERGGRDYR